jgi:N-acetylmuramoyl-L-alanine amidase
MIGPERVGSIDLVDLVDELPRHPGQRYAARLLREIKRIVVHHSATPTTTTPQSMANYHVRKHGWAGIGYHFVVAADGTLFQTNRLETVSYHVGGHNTASVGICFVGNFMKAPPPPEQLVQGAALIGWLLGQLPQLTPDCIVGHCELNATSCPGRPQWMTGARWKDALLQEIDAWLTTTTATS